VRRGELPESVETAAQAVAVCSDLLWTTVLERTERAPTAEARRWNEAIDYLAERLQEHVKALRVAVYGFDDDDDDGEDLAA
jgi:hypothetical protein